LNSTHHSLSSERNALAFAAQPQLKRPHIPQRFSSSVISISCRAKTTGFQLCSWRDVEEAKATPKRSEQEICTVQTSKNDG
jgi:hypothetical protein